MDENSLETTLLDVFAKSLGTFSASALSYIMTPIAKEILLYVSAECLKPAMPTVQEAIKRFITIYEETESTSSTDFVEVNESSIKEFEIPEKFTFRIGNNRIRISTSLFVTILGSIIIPIALHFSGIIYDLNHEAQNAPSYERHIQIEQEKNNVIKEQNILIDKCLHMLDSVDTSSSSQAETIVFLNYILSKDIPSL